MQAAQTAWSYFLMILNEGVPQTMRDNLECFLIRSNIQNSHVSHAACGDQRHLLNGFDGLAVAYSSISLDGSKTILSF